MAAIDEIYLNSYKEYKEFQEWLLKQPKLKDKYGTEVSIYVYFSDWLDDPKDWENNNSHIVFFAPCYVDAYLIRNCPLEYVQKELMVNYGYKTQEDIDEMYNSVINRTPEDQKLIDDANGKYPSKPISWWWLSKDDFEVVDGVIKMPRMEKSPYERIKDGELFTSPTREGTYEVGKHFKIIQKPYPNKCNYPISYRSERDNVKRQPSWDVDIKLPDSFEEHIWWHDSSKIGTWDFSSEFVETYGWTYSGSTCPSLKSLKRRILKWKLPVGTIVTLQGRYVGEDYKIVVKK